MDIAEHVLLHDGVANLSELTTLIEALNASEHIPPIAKGELYRTRGFGIM